MPPRLQSLRGEFAGGVASAIPGLAHALALGILAFAALGPELADIGLRAGFAARIFGGIAATVRSGTPLPATGARASTSLILAGFVAILAADRALDAGGVFGLAILCVAMSGVLQILFGVLRLGSVAKFVPYPVLGGFSSPRATRRSRTSSSSTSAGISRAGCARPRMPCAN
jgi:sulfate permease, SulP family